MDLSARGSALILALTMMACGPTKGSDDRSALQWHTGAALFRGHEDLTRFAVERANGTLSGLQGALAFPQVPSGEDGVSSNHPLVRGNYETDFPSSRMRRFYAVSADVDWHDAPSLQYLHSLRNHVGGGVTDNAQTCATVQAAIIRAAEESTSLWQQGDRDGGLYWAGHALHILQDSYSPAHARRRGPEGAQITGFCSYGREIDGVCHHSAVDERDRIWRTDRLRCTFDSDRRSWGCLTSQAQHAVLGSAKLLVALEEARVRGGDVREQLLSVFQGRDAQPGILDCRSL